MTSFIHCHLQFHNLHVSADKFYSALCTLGWSWTQRSAYLYLHGTGNKSKHHHAQWRYFFLIIYLSCVYTCVYVWECAFMWRLEDNFWKLFLSFCHVGVGDQSQVIRLGDWCLCQLSHLTSLNFFFLHLSLKRDTSN